MQPRTTQVRLVRWAVHGGAAVVLLIATAVFLSLGVRPLVGSRQGRLADIQRRQQMQEAAASAMATQADLRAALADMQQRQSQLRRRIPDDAGEHDFLRSITHAAGEAGLNIVDYQHDGVATDDARSVLRITLRCRGSYAAICRVLDHLQHHDRLVIIEHLHITSDMASDEHAIEMSVALIFGLKTPTTAAQENANA